MRAALLVGLLLAPLAGATPTPLGGVTFAALVGPAEAPAGAFVTEGQWSATGWCGGQTMRVHMVLAKLQGSAWVAFYATTPDGQCGEVHASRLDGSWASGWRTDCRDIPFPCAQVTIGAMRPGPIPVTLSGASEGHRVGWVLGPY